MRIKMNNNHQLKLSNECNFEEAEARRRNCVILNDDTLIELLCFMIRVDLLKMSLVSNRINCLIEMQFGIYPRLIFAHLYTGADTTEFVYINCGTTVIFEVTNQILNNLMLANIYYK